MMHFIGTTLVWILAGLVLGAVIVLLDRKFLVGTITYLTTPEDARPAEGDRKGLLIGRGSGTRLFWALVVVSLVSVYVPSGAVTFLESFWLFCVKLGVVWLAFLKPNTVIATWEGRKALFGAIDKAAKGDGAEIGEKIAVAKGWLERLQARWFAFVARLKSAGAKINELTPKEPVASTAAPAPTTGPELNGARVLDEEPQAPRRDGIASYLAGTNTGLPPAATPGTETQSDGPKS